MRLCYLAGGNTIHSHRWIRYFAERGHEVHWISLTALEVPEIPGVRYYDRSTRLPMWASMAVAALGIRRLVRDIAPDLLHAHYASSYGVLGVRSGFQPFVLTAWGSDILIDGKGVFRGALVRRALDRARLITCDATHMIEAMSRLGADPARMRVVNFGTEVERFCPGPPDPAVLDRWGLAGKRVVISLRNLEPVYDVGTLLAAAPLVLKSVPDARFVLAGEGSSVTALKDQADRLGIAPFVRFIGRYRSADLPAMLRSSEIYVSTSLADAGLSGSTSEAMSCGVPVVVSDTGENDRWIEPGRSGFLFRAGDAGALAARILDLLADEELRRSMGERGRAVIVDRNNHTREMEKVERMYEELVRTVAPAAAPK